MLNNPWRVQTWRAYYRSLYPTRKPPDFEAYLSALASNLAQPGRFDAARQLGFSSRAPSQSALGHVAAPVLVVMGSRDPDFRDPAAEAQAVARLTGGQVSMIEGAGHYPQTEMAEKTGQVVLDFLKSLKPATV